jgi:hypothetical protein
LEGCSGGDQVAKGRGGFSEVSNLQNSVHITQIAPLNAILYFSLSPGHLEATIFQKTRSIDIQFYAGLGPATSNPSNPSIGSSGRLPAPSLAWWAAFLSSSLTACSARYPSYCKVSINDFPPPAAEDNAGPKQLYLFPNCRLTPQPASLVLLFRLCHGDFYDLAE